MPRKPACERDDIIKVISAAKKQVIVGQNIAVSSEKGVLCSQGDHIPVVQMLTENHTISSTSNWLNEWQRAGASPPKEAVCDFSLALLGALVKAFTPYPDLKTYINQCFGVLTKKLEDS
ncbi:hypothetical protein Baya_15120 [Bagarius yarrelli]|uniref:Uncharacterized protein n=1 Tax=Bagarius yarrelli TaxID=175774 RepID=A0A556VB19_BAGYA|nr:hypothetical protein Baya_15120 [Bagarius yarrelli]